MNKYGADVAAEHRYVSWRQRFSECTSVREQGKIINVVQVHTSFSNEGVAAVLEITERAVQRGLTAASLEKHVFSFLETVFPRQELMQLLDSPTASVLQVAKERGYTGVSTPRAKLGRPGRTSSKFDDVALVEAIRVIETQFGGSAEAVAARLDVPPYLVYRLRPLLTMSPMVLAAGRKHGTPRQLMLRLVTVSEDEGLMAVQSYADGKPLAAVLADLAGTEDNTNNFGVHAVDLTSEFVDLLRSTAHRLDHSIRGHYGIHPATTMAVSAIEVLVDTLDGKFDMDALDSDDLEDVLMGRYSAKRGQGGS